MRPTASPLVEALLDEAATANRRLMKRYPFFRQATITIGGSTTLSAFSRDISPSGVGLLHSMPLEPGQVTVKLAWGKGSQIDVRTEIRWCRAAGEGWYLSGGRFLRLSVRQVTAFLISAFKAEADRRLKQRYPFFRPITIIPTNGKLTELAAFSRDISPSGIGLLHRVRIDPGYVTVALPSLAGHPLEASTEIRWCAPAGGGWYLSGGRFVSLLLEELPDRLL
jgi:hypothetical protein